MPKITKGRTTGEEKQAPLENPRGGVNHHARKAPPHWDKLSFTKTIEVVEKIQKDMDSKNDE